MRSGKFCELSRGVSFLPWGIRKVSRPTLILAYCIISGIDSFNLSGLRINARYLPSNFSPRMSSSIDGLATAAQEIIDKKTEISTVTTSGLIEYIGNTIPADKNTPRWSNNRMIFKHPTSRQVFFTKVKLWQQLPWKKIKGKTILKVKISGDLTLDPSSSGFSGFSSFGSKPDYELISSLTDATTLFNYAAYDPRVTAIILDIGSLSCGYAKLNEFRRLIDYFQQSGKEVIGYSAAASEKEFFIGLACSEYYVPPDGSLDLRGFSSAAAFIRGVLDKVGIEPQVQRIGKYKSAGDSLNRTFLSDAQREVISSLIQEGSDYWVDNIIQNLNKKITPTTATVTNPATSPTPTTTATGSLDAPENIASQDSVQQSLSPISLKTKSKDDIINELWESEQAKNPYDFKSMGYITGVLYLDQIEQMVKLKNLSPLKTNWFISIFLKLFPKFDTTTPPLATTGDFDLQEDTKKYPRRSLVDSLSIPRMNVPLITTDESGDLSSTYTTTTTSTTTTTTTTTTTSLNESEQQQQVVSLADQKKKEKEEKVASLKSKHEKELLDERKPSLIAAKTYLRKMRKGNYILKGLTFKETPRGSRIAIINASGAISTGKSGSSGVSGNTLGSDTFIELLQKARADSSIKGVVIRIDSPGGSALASDLMWREIRLLSREKPVIGSMVDVAASGGYYMAMACDRIVAEDMTITGSIGVVTAKFNAQELFQKIGYGVEVLSKGKFAEVLSTTRGFTEDEEKYFARFAQQAYDSFVTKAATSRSMTKEQMQEVAQGRVWTGRQGLQRGLVDHIGGLAVALQLAASLSDLPVTSCLNVQTLTNERKGLAGILGGGASMSSSTTSDLNGKVMTLTDDAIASCGFASMESMGVGSAIANMGLSPSIAFALSHNPSCRQFLNFLLTSKNSPSVAELANNVNFFEYVKFALEDFVDSLTIM